ncbi:MAG TPA: multiheme c-type cytochrome [Isosphaeraceae bacterium]|nr:multiheme c-type cytochrome [Isosphaeraceae bacterium]
MIPLLALALVASAGLWMTWASRRTSPPLSRHRPDPPSPYPNTRPGVKYVGDAACARCHAEITRTFREHPMGRSLSPIAAAGVADGGDRPRFTAQGLEYSVEHRGGRVIHREARRDAQGCVIAQHEAEVQFAIGSGRQGITFLIERDGFLFESPITWCPRQRRWDLSPGYEARNTHFDRPIQAECLYCHANRVEPVEGTINRYQQPIFRGHAIGCERCHGPGELHVVRPEPVAGQAPRIVNPARLEPALREAVCEQCHLLGERRVVRAAGGARTIGPVCRSPASGRCSCRREDRPRTGSSGRSNRCTRADASAPVEVGSGASPATTHINGPAPRRRWPRTGIVAWTATPTGVVASRGISGSHGAGTRIAPAVTIPVRPTLAGRPGIPA